MYSLKYGTVPVVRKTGGLADTVLDWGELSLRGLDSGTGFSFNNYDTNTLISSVKRAVDAYKQKEIWNKIIFNGMSKDYSWEVSAQKYIDMYKTAIYNRRT